MRIGPIFISFGLVLRATLIPSVHLCAEERKNFLAIYYSYSPIGDRREDEREKRENKYICRIFHCFDFTILLSLSLARLHTQCPKSSEKRLFLTKRQIIFRILYILLFMLCINTQYFCLFYSPILPLCPAFSRFILLHFVSGSVYLFRSHHVLRFRLICFSSSSFFLHSTHLFSTLVCLRANIAFFLLCKKNEKLLR